MYETSKKNVFFVSLWIAFVGRYHKSDFERAVVDLCALRAAWERSAAELSLPYSSWFFTFFHCGNANGRDAEDIVMNVRECPWMSACSPLRRPMSAPIREDQ